MEELYKKLYKKYTEEKDKRESQFDKLSRDQEEKFLNFMTAADETIQYLSTQNEKLSEQVKELKSQLASIRTSTDEQHVHYQKLLIEENQKNEKLSEEISMLQKVEHNYCSRCSLSMKIGSGQEYSLHDPSKETQSISGKGMMKKRKFDHINEGTAATYVDVEHDPPEGQHILGDISNGAPPINQQPLCQRKIYKSGGDAADPISFSCMFQYLVEFVVGMKVTPLTESNGLCISLLHQLSGYSFSLTLITNWNGEVELLYRVLSLGTFEKVVPEWMKEMMMFSPSMCRIFFDRVSRVIKS